MNRKTTSVRLYRATLAGLLLGALMLLTVSLRWRVLADHVAEVILFLLLFLVPTVLLASVMGLLRPDAAVDYAVGLLGAAASSILAFLWVDGLAWWGIAFFALVGAAVGVGLGRSAGRMGGRWVVASAVTLVVVAWLLPAATGTGSRSGKKPVLLLGVDAANWTLLDRLLSEGRMPTFRRLIETGASGTLLSEEPSISPRVWTTLATGKGPEEHGIESFYSTQAELKVPRLWDLARYHGYSVGLFQWLATWPPASTGDFVVPGWMARDARTHPESLQFIKELELAFQNQSIAVKSLNSMRRWSLGYLDYGLRLRTCLKIADLALRDILLDDRWQTSYAAKRQIQLYLNGDLLLDLVRRYRPDFLAAVFYGSDSLAHKLWKYTFSEDFGLSREEAAPFADLLPRYYEAVDWITAELLRELPDDVTVLIVSDHGFASTRPSAKTSATTGRIAEPRLLALTELLGLQVPEQVAVASVGRQGYFSFRGESEEARRRFGQAREFLEQVHLAGENDALFLVREIDPTQFRVQVELPRGVPRESVVSTPKGERRLEDLIDIEQQGGSHSIEGILIAHGPGIRQGGKVDKAYLRDLVPSVLYHLELPVGADMPGRVLEELFVTDLAASRGPDFVPTYDELDLLPEMAEPESDREALEEQLRALGYLN